MIDKIIEFIDQNHIIERYWLLALILIVAAVILSPFLKRTYDRISTSVHSNMKRKKEDKEWAKKVKKANKRLEKEIKPYISRYRKSKDVDKIAKMLRSKMPEKPYDVYFLVWNNKLDCNGFTCYFNFYDYGIQELKNDAQRAALAIVLAEKLGDGFEAECRYEKGYSSVSAGYYVALGAKVVYAVKKPLKEL